MKVLAILNILAALAFAALLVFGTMMAEVDARMKFTQLDREGAINAPALAQFDASHGYGFEASGVRATVPVWVSESALSYLRGTAVLGLIVSGMNAILFIVASVRSRARRLSDR